jgi:hypothetical protein
MTTPAAQDGFTRFMAKQFDDREMIAVTTAGQAFFGNPAAGGRTIFSPDANVVDIDIVRGNEKIAALIPRGAISRTLGDKQSDMQNGKMTAFSRKYPLSEESGNITGDMILNRIPGEQAFATMTRFNRMRYHALNIHLESIRRTVRMFEVLAWQSVTTGKQDAIIGTSNTDLQYDFRRNSTHTVTVGTSWSTITADALGDLDAMCKKIRANGRITPNMCVMGDTAIDNFIKNTAVQTLADNRRFELIDVTTNNPVPPEFNRFVEGGMIPRGRIKTPKGFTLWIFTMTDGYDNSSGTFTKYLADDKVLIGSSKARCDRYFGPPENLPIDSVSRAFYAEYFGFNQDAPPMPLVRSAGGVIDPNMFYCDAEKTDRKKVTIFTQSAPIFATTHTDAFGLIDTII